MGSFTAILRNVSGPQNVDQETCAETIRGMEIIGNSADVKYWAEECIELNPPFEVKSEAAFLADFKPYGKESYYWTVKDHLSAVRVILDDDGDVVHSQDYYAFGLRWDYNDSPTYDKNRVGVIEQTGVAQNLDLMDYRLFDRTTGRFLSVDPHADRYPSWSPCTYVFYNPLIFSNQTVIPLSEIRLHNVWRQVEFLYESLSRTHHREWNLMSAHDYAKARPVVIRVNQLAGPQTLFASPRTTSAEHLARA